MFRTLLPLLLTSSLCLAALQEHKDLFTVVIDPGHGGSDRGATRGKLSESDLALTFAKKLAKKINQDKSMLAILTRNDDFSLTLKQRVKVANDKQGEIFISIHANASTDPRARGTELYFRTQHPPRPEDLAFWKTKEAAMKPRDPASLTEVDELLSDLQNQSLLWTSHTLSGSMSVSLPRSRSRSSQSVQQAPFYVISRSRIPSALIELGFISNAKEAEWLKNSGHQDEMIDFIFQGILDFKKKLRPDSPSVKDKTHEKT